MPVYEQGSHHTCRPLTTCPRGRAFSCLPPPRTKTIVNTLWFLSDDKIAAALPAALPRDTVNLDDLRFVEPQKVLVFGLDVKAEGLCVLSEEAGSSKSPVRRARLALVYDNDTAKTGEPGLLQFITLLRWPDYTP